MITITKTTIYMRGHGVEVRTPKGTGGVFCERDPDSRRWRLLRLLWLLEVDPDDDCEFV
jgi:hypothetical protein